MPCEKLDAATPFVNDWATGRPIGATVGDFWQWAFSDLASNDLRGIVAEFLVGLALGVDFDEPRKTWGDFDLLTPEGTSVEVKATGLVQAWQSRGSPPQFGSLRAKALTPDGASYQGEAVVRADVFVFCFHAAPTRTTYDPSDVSQWEFYVLPAATIDATGQKSIRLSRVRNLTSPVPHAALRRAVMAASPHDHLPSPR